MKKRLKGPPAFKRPRIMRERPGNGRLVSSDRNFLRRRTTSAPMWACVCTCETGGIHPGYRAGMGPSLMSRALPRSRRRFDIFASWERSKPGGSVCTVSPQIRSPDSLASESDGGPRGGRARDSLPATTTRCQSRSMTPFARADVTCAGESRKGD